jgi:hypothetical protein
LSRRVDAQSYNYRNNRGHPVNEGRAEIDFLARGPRSLSAKSGFGPSLRLATGDGTI